MLKRDFGSTSRNIVVLISLVLLYACGGQDSETVSPASPATDTPSPQAQIVNTVQPAVDFGNAPPINRDRLVETFMDIVRIDSPSGDELLMAVDLVNRLRAMGLDVSRDDHGNVIATDGGENPLLLSTHIDTVEPGRGVKPRVEGDRIVTDGTTVLGGDAKAGVAAILEAVHSIMERGAPHRGIQLAFTLGEEIGLVGASNLDYSRITATQGVVLDAEGPVNQITSGTPDFGSFEIEVLGRAAHAGIEPEKGLSSIRIASEIILRLPQGRLNEDTTFNVGLIEGGSVRNAVPERTLITGEFRSHNRDALFDLKAQIEQTVADVTSEFPGSVIRPTIRVGSGGYSLADDDPMLISIRKALDTIGLEPIMKRSGAGTDANVFRGRSIDAVVIGMGDYNLHSFDEHVVISELVDAARVCRALLMDM